MAFEKNSIDGHIISTANSTSGILASGATFTGTWEDVTKYSTAALTVLGSMVSSGTAYFDLSTDGGSTYTSVPNTVADASFALPRVLNIVESHIRIRYVNGDTAQTGTFSLQTKYSNAQPLGLLSSVGGSVTAETPASVHKTVHFGKQPLDTYRADPANGVAFCTSGVLSSGANYESTGWIDTHGYNTIEIFLESDQISAVDGIEIEFTDDLDVGTVRETEAFSFTTIDVATGYRNIFIHPRLVGFRFRYTNGNTLQGNFFAQCDLKTHGNITYRLDENLRAGDDTILVRDASDFQLDTARQKLGSTTASFFFGFSSAVDTSWSDIHPNGGDINWQTSASTLGFASSDAADTAAGLGVRSIEIHGLSATGEDQEEIITMSGTTEVDSVLSYTRLNKMHNETVGTYGGSHQGDVTARISSSGAKTGAIMSIMEGDEGAVDTSVQYGLGEAGNGYWSVPSGKVMYVTRLQVIPDVAGNKTVDIALYEREEILNTSGTMAPRRILWKENAIQDAVTKDFNSYLKIKPLTDIWFRSKASAASAVEVYLDFILVDENADGK